LQVIKENDPGSTPAERQYSSRSAGRKHRSGPVIIRLHKEQKDPMEKVETVE
jgi:hypothetical protein